MFDISLHVSYGSKDGTYDITGCDDYIAIECRNMGTRYSRVERNYHSKFCLFRLMPILKEALGYEFREYIFREVYKIEEDWSISLMSNGNMVGESYIQHNHTVDELTENNIEISIEDLRRVFLEYRNAYLGTMEDKKVTLDKDEYKQNIKMVRVTKKLKRELDNVCGICLEELKVGNMCAMTKCNHGFHPKCLKRWLTKECVHPKCPMCNKDVRD